MFLQHGAGKRPDPDFERFVVDRSTALLRTAVLLIGDRGHAEDLLQTALLRTALRWRQARDHPEAYVRRVLINLARDHWRRSRRRVAEDSLDAFRAVPSNGRDIADGVAARDALRCALAALPQRQREVVVLRFVEDLSVAETAAALRTSEGTVKSHTSRAMARVTPRTGGIGRRDRRDDGGQSCRVTGSSTTAASSAGPIPH